MNQVLGAKAPKKQRTVADDAAEILEASHYQELFDRFIACTFLWFTDHSHNSMVPAETTAPSDATPVTHAGRYAQVKLTCANKCARDT